MIEKFTHDELITLRSEINEYFANKGIAKSVIGNTILEKTEEVFPREDYEEYWLFPACDAKVAIMSLVDCVLNLYQKSGKLTAGRPKWKRVNRVENIQEYMDVADAILEVVKKYKKDWKGK